MVVPRCLECGKTLINCIDRVTGEKSKNLWMCDCEHGKGFILCLG